MSCQGEAVKPTHQEKWRSQEWKVVLACGGNQATSWFLASKVLYCLIRILVF